LEIQSLSGHYGAVAGNALGVAALIGLPSWRIERMGRGMKHLYIDGGITIQRFLEAGLIQRVIITRVPVLLGSGIPLFGPLSRETRFEHVATRSYPSGLVQSEYVIPD